MLKKSILIMSVLGLTTTLHATKWGFCKDKKAYADANYSTPKPEADGICGLPTASESGDTVFLNTQRCLNDQALKCEAKAVQAAGLTPDPNGDGDVPQNAWYAIGSASTDPKYKSIKCSCGCFTPSTRLLTETGWQRIDRLMERSNRTADRLLIPATDKGSVFKFSDKLKPSQFTKGEELDPIIRVYTEGKRMLEMTRLHPVLIEKNSQKHMVQAKTLKVGDIVYSTNGETLRVTHLMTRELRKDDNLVYNVNTEGLGDDEHVIIANGIRVGDLGWQNKLAEREQRVNSIISM